MITQHLIKLYTLKEYHYYRCLPAALLFYFCKKVTKEQPQGRETSPPAQ